MLFQITKNTKIEDLIIAGASIDGKITQQAVFIKLGLKTPITFFFNSKIAKIKNGKIILQQDFYSQVIKPYENRPYQYQIRTENVNEANRTIDTFSETRIGLTTFDIEENLINILTGDKRIKDTVGIIQILPPKSLDRNLISGLARIVTINKKYHLYMSLHRGIATYVGRVGSFDAVLDIPLDKLSTTEQNSHIDLTPYLKFKPKQEILKNIALNLKRFGITALVKDIRPLGLKTPLKLPFNHEKGRIKKEYELTNVELSDKNYPKQIKNFTEILAKFKEDLIVQYISTGLNLKFTKNMNLDTLLICAGALYISLTGDKYNSTKNELLELINGKNIKEIFYPEVLELVISDIPKIGEETLVSHAISFSVVVNEFTDKSNLILWDMPIDNSLSIVSNRAPSKDLVWITAPKQDLTSLKNKDAIGIDLPISEYTNQELLVLLERLQSYPNIKDVYIKYALLSHLATIIREHNFNVISI